MQRATLLTRANNPFIFYATECPTGRVPAGGGPAAAARGVRMPEIHVDFYVDFFLTSNYKT